MPQFHIFVGYKRLTGNFYFYILFPGMPGIFFYHHLGKIISHLREKKGLTQEQLCLLSYVNRSYFFKIENGTANPSLKILNKICRVLRIKICDLLKISRMSQPPVSNLRGSDRAGTEGEV